MKVPLLDLTVQYRQIQKEIHSAIQGVLKTQHFILGTNVLELENKIAKYSDAKYAIGVASGSDALLLSLTAIGIERGDEVITSPYTFFATAGSISRLGAKPVFVDIDPKTFNINPELIQKKITKRTKAIIPVHLFGQSADMSLIQKIARKKKLVIIEDAAQSLGANYKGKKTGSIGDLGCLSFFPSKNLGAFGDGGMVVTNNAKLAEKIRILRVHGSAERYYHSVIGMNSRLDELQAAVLCVKFKYLERWNTKRQENAEIYDRLLKSAPIERPSTAKSCAHIYNQYVIRAPKRDELRAFLSARKIGTEIYYPVPLHLQECYKSLRHRKGDFPESEKAARETLALPIYPELTFAQQKEVAEAIRAFYEPNGRFS